MDDVAHFNFGDELTAAAAVAEANTSEPVSTSGAFASESCIVCGEPRVGRHRFCKVHKARL
jgi:hypothetical protein